MTKPLNYIETGNSLIAFFCSRHGCPVTCPLSVLPNVLPGAPLCITVFGYPILVSCTQREPALIFLQCICH